MSANQITGPSKTISLIVRSYELDSLGHVNNAVYSHYLEHARIEYFRAVGFSLRDYFSSGCAFVLAETHIRFRKSAFMGEELHITSDLTLVGVRLEFNQEITRGTDLIVTAVNTIASLSPEGRPCAPPAALRDRLLT